MSRLTTLANYSEAELLEELARRCNSKEAKGHVAKWCHDCKHFKAWDDGQAVNPKEMPKNYNPCAKQHKRYFRMPEDYASETGFYRAVCKDRDEVQEA